MLLNARYIGNDKIFIPSQHGFSSRYAVITPSDAERLTINQDVQIVYVSPSDIKVILDENVKETFKESEESQTA